MDEQVFASELSGFDNEHLDFEWRRRVAANVGYEGLELAAVVDEPVNNTEPIVEVVEVGDDSI